MKQPPHQVRNMLLHPPKIFKVKEISGKVQKAAPKQVAVTPQNWLLIRMPQNMHYWLMKQPPHQVRNMLLHPQKYLKSKKYVERAKKLHQNWLLIRMPQNMHYWPMNQPPHQVRNMLLHPPKSIKSQRNMWKGQKSCTKTGC